MNRGLGQRTLFETRHDHRQFLALLARSVRRREISVACYCLMSNHFHLVVKSHGNLSVGMKRIQSEYVKWFNFVRERDGTLFRGRFQSKWIQSEEYWFHLVRYVERNPVSAGVVKHAADYPYSSAGIHCGRRRWPPWLDRRQVFEVFGLRHGDARSGAQMASLLADSPESVMFDELVERSLQNSGVTDPWHEVRGMARGQLAAWLDANARRADGGRVRLVIARVSDIRRVVEAERQRVNSQCGAEPLDRISPWTIMEIGLRRDLAAERFAEASLAFDLATSTIHRLYASHRRRYGDSERYRVTVDRIAAMVSDTLFPCGKKASDTE